MGNGTVSGFRTYRYFFVEGEGFFVCPCSYLYHTMINWMIVMLCVEKGG